MKRVICHIAGPSGSGKTTLLKRIDNELSNVVVKDLDEFDDQALLVLNLDSVKKKEWKREDFENLAKLREELMDEFIASSEFPIVFGGSNREDDIEISIPTEHFYLIDIDAKTSAERAYERSQSEKIEHRRTLEDLPFDIEEAEEVISFYISKNYEKKSADEIFDAVKAML